MIQSQIEKLPLLLNTSSLVAVVILLERHTLLTFMKAMLGLAIPALLCFSNLSSVR